MIENFEKLSGISVTDLFALINLFSGLSLIYILIFFLPFSGLYVIQQQSMYEQSNAVHSEPPTCYLQYCAPLWEQKMTMQ